VKVPAFNVQALQGEEILISRHGKRSLGWLLSEPNQATGSSASAASLSSSWAAIGRSRWRPTKPMPSGKGAGEPNALAGYCHWSWSWKCRNRSWCSTLIRFSGGTTTRATGIFGAREEFTAPAFQEW